MTEDALDHGRLVDERDQAHPAAAPRAGEDVEAETPLHQTRPEIARGGACVLERFAGVAALLGGNDLRPPRRPWSQHTVVEDQVDSRSGCDGRQTLEQLGRVAHQMGGARPSSREREPHLALRRQPESVRGDGRAEGIPDHTLESIPAAGANPDGGVEIEAVLSGMTGPGARCLGLLGRVAAPPDTPPRESPAPRPHPRHQGRAGDEPPTRINTAATAQEVAKLLVDEPGHTAAVALVPRLREERLEVIADEFAPGVFVGQGFSSLLRRPEGLRYETGFQGSQGSRFPGKIRVPLRGRARWSCTSRKKPSEAELAPFLQAAPLPPEA